MVNFDCADAEIGFVFVEIFFTSVLLEVTDEVCVGFFGTVADETAVFFGVIVGGGLDFAFEYVCGDDERLESSDDDSLEDSLDDSDELDEITFDGLTLFAGFRPTGADEVLPVDFFVELEFSC